MGEREQRCSQDCSNHGSDEMSKVQPVLGKKKQNEKLKIPLEVQKKFFFLNNVKVISRWYDFEVGKKFLPAPLGL